MAFPEPESGLVIFYSYLWWHENEARQEAWVILDDFNEFTWPGFDLYPMAEKPGRYDYGFLPPNLLKKIIDLALELKREGRVFSSQRNEQ